MTALPNLGGTAHDRSEVSMIVDCHTHIWDTPSKWGRALVPAVVQTVQADATRHLQASDPVDRSIVLAFKSRYLDAEIPNRYVAEYVRQNPGKLVGFAGIDPTERDWLEELRIAQDELHLKGVTISPGMQNFHPTDLRAMRLYEECVRREMPILVEHNHRNPGARLEFSRPLLLDEVAREFPRLRLVVAHLGYPWIDETVVLLGKHANVFSDIAGLQRQPWLTYNALLAAFEGGVMDKLLFGSDFPYRSPAACIEALYNLNQIVTGTSLPNIPREHLRGMVERDALGLLGIAPHAAPSPRPRASIFEEET